MTAFLQRQHEVLGQYKSITTESNETISLSANHLIYARDNNNGKYEAK